MNRRLALATLAALAATTALTAGCAARPDIRHDRDPAVDLAGYRRFAFYDSDASGPYASLIGARLKQAARAELEKRHFAYDEADPELRVNVSLLVIEGQELRNVAGPRGYRGLHGVEAVDVRNGTLGVDLVDVRRNALVWQGIADGRVSQRAVDDPGPAIATVMAEIFAGFPQREGAR